MQAIIQKITTNTDNRIIAVSDIHGYVNYLDGLLKKINYSVTDNLIIVGDLIEKGPKSLETVRYVLKLKEENPNIYVSMGNIEYSRIGSFFDESDEGNAAFLKGINYAKSYWNNGFFLDILKELNICPDTLEISDIPSLKKLIRQHYSRELEFLWGLPAIIMYGNFVFVHAGIDSEDERKLMTYEAFKYLKMDNFINRGYSFDKTVVVGHWPVCIYRDNGICHNVLFDYDKHIISIDGGCALKSDAQLNALLIPGAYSGIDEVKVETYDDYPVITAKAAQEGKAPQIIIRYFDSAVEIIEDGNDYAMLRQISSGRVFATPKSYMYKSGGELHCEDISDALLEVKKGDRLSVIADTAYGMLVKKNGTTGWYRRNGKE